MRVITQKGAYIRHSRYLVVINKPAGMVVHPSAGHSGVGQCKLDSDLKAPPRFVCEKGYRANSAFNLEPPWFCLSLQHYTLGTLVNAVLHHCRLPAMRWGSTTPTSLIGHTTRV